MAELDDCKLVGGYCTIACEVNWEENTIFHSSICNWILFSGESFYKESNSLTIIKG